MRKNKFIILFLIITLITLFCFYNVAFGETYDVLDFKYGKVNVECLNVRCGPGITYNRV